jgi:hypothetical protein
VLIGSIFPVAAPDDPAGERPAATLVQLWAKKTLQSSAHCDKGP